MKLAALFAVTLLIGSASFAADSENSGSDTTKTTHNSMTGSDTTKVKHHHKKKNADGTSDTMDSTSTTKVKKDGSMKKTTKTEENTTN